MRVSCSIAVQRTTPEQQFHGGGDPAEFSAVPAPSVRAPTPHVKPM